MMVLGWEESPACMRTQKKASVPRRQKLRKQVSHEVGESGPCKAENLF